MAVRKVRVVAMDLDGTLLRSNGSLAEETRRAVQACLEHGMHCVIATARPPRAVAALLPPNFPDMPWICYNGAEVYEKQKRVAQNALDPTLVLGIIRTIQIHAAEATISAEIDDCLVADRPLSSWQIHRVVDLFAEIDRPVAKVLFDAAAVTDVERLRAALPSTCRVVVTDGGRLGQIMARSVSKATALGVLLDRWYCSFAEVIAFGDDLNDLEMLAASGYGVAMENAHPEVKAIADHVTSSNDDDGVARVLRLVSGPGLPIPTTI